MYVFTVIKSTFNVKFLQISGFLGMYSPHSDNQTTDVFWVTNFSTNFTR